MGRKDKVEKQKDTPVNPLMALFSREPSKICDDYKFAFHWLLLLLPVIAFAMITVLRPYTQAINPPAKQFSPLAFLINDIFKAYSIDSAVVPSLSISLLGLALYQQRISVFAAMILALFPLLNRPMFSLLLVPSFSVFFLALVIGMSLAFLSTHFPVTSFAWMFICIFASALLGSAFYIRPDSIGPEAMMFLSILANIIIYSMKHVKADFEFIAKFLSMNTQIFTVAFPFLAVSFLFGDIPAPEISFFLSEPSVFIRVLTNDIFGYFPLFVSLLMLWKMERNVTSLVCVFSCLIASVIALFVPVEGIDSPVEGKLLSIKTLMLFLTSTVFGRITPPWLSLLLPSLAVFASAGSYILN